MPNTILSLIVIATIPLAIYTIVNSNLDMRKFAFEDEISESCTIILPHVNEKTLAQDKKYQIVVHGEFNNESVKNLVVQDKAGDSIFSKEFSPPTDKILENFVYTPTSIGEEIISGFVETNKTRHQCKMETDFILVREKNYAPIFLTNPYVSAEPNTNSLVIGNEYKYTMEASDRDDDRVQYHYSLTPEADWLHKEVVQNGDFGNLEITFSGRPDEAGTYLATVYIHDGYQGHISSQSWIINVNERGINSSYTERPSEPLIPKVSGEFDNIIKLNGANISNLTPNTNSMIKDRTPRISVILNASDGSEILKESIKFKLNTEDILNRTDIIEISPEQFKLTYITANDIREGEHQISISFEDSNGSKFDSISNFETQTEEEGSNLFGMPISTIAIILIGVALIILALAIPWILYIAWKKNEEAEYEEASLPKQD